ncbi:MAG: Ig-like domain-containing protein [Candidatus Thiodiazotropha sp. (ex Semelilucina semeliformis)]|nr:Ig-like domain-containing protein [Candidatus Thiodiazotropha sp. (ex Myrtea spinifera)]MCU7807369.1 Ig-like domain-containing protein [Candidatus Thiodiazotropha sp. (ex Semelilucina semeliformis)]
MRIFKQETWIGLALLLSLTLSGCGGSDTASSSTNNTDGAPPINPPRGNQQPTAIITAPQAFISGETATLDGSSSSDPDGDTLSFLWTQTQGTTIALSDNTSPSLSFLAPTVTQPAQYTFQLTVADGELSNTATVNFQVSPLVDTTAPSVTARSPLPNQTGIATSAQISVAFDEALLGSSVDSQSLTLTQNGNPVSAIVSYDSNSHSIRLTPNTQLSGQTTYTVTLGATVQDLSGNFASSESWSFTTATSQYNLGATTQQTIDQCMGHSEKLMLTLVNNARAATRSCGSASYPAVAPLAWHCLLENAAQGHSTSMADNDYHDHTGIDGSSPGDRITAAGYIWRSYGENIAGGYPDEDAVMEGWLNSPGHCSNIMNSRFTELGAASAENSASTYRIYWTQNFASQ